MTTNETTLTGLRNRLADVERKLDNARPVDVAGGSTTSRRASLQRRADRLRAAIARVEGDAELTRAQGGEA